MINLAALHDDILEDAALHEASQHVWYPQHGPALLLKHMKMTHLVRSLRFTRRNLERVIKQRDDALCYAQGKWSAGGFDGCEDRIALSSLNLDALILEVHRRLRKALRAGRTITTEDAVNLQASDLVRPDALEVQRGLEIVRSAHETPELPDEHPQDEKIPF